ncbi:MAG: DUF2130 domain-containing protein [Bacteroidia bacterium]|nr:DUF2130 domain-containing protein [Bacteroidia bacterium]MCF8425534.1 DUF2130 domain-containing protein [Bacteroidia bacterium]MCF8445847.1 DUF2130 domain-containing protein [Bacteroidia bacterium]
MEKENKINCPNCGFGIDVNELVFHQMEEEIKKEFNSRLADEKKKYDKEFDLLKQKQLEFEEKKKKENELFQDRLNQKEKELKESLEKKLRLQLESEQQDQIKLMQNELNSKQEQLKELNRTKAEIEQLKREKDMMREQVTMEAEKALTTKLGEEREKIKKLEQDKNEMVVRELQKQLEDQKRLTEEMKRKQDQGSMQLQGEVQELAIENWLMQQFPLDTIAEIKKGARGGDCVQIVNTRERQNCGTIYYESKRTKEFQASWIEKFKADIREKGASIGVLVTDVFPSDMDRVGLKDGIWVCSYEEFKGLCKVLRESIIQLDTALSTQENRGDKMSMLYNFLTSNTFRMQIEAIVEGFTQMQSDLDAEKRSMQRIWKTREKQIEKVVNNTIDMYGSIKGIAGNAVMDIKALELPGASDSLELED